MLFDLPQEREKAISETMAKHEAKLCAIDGRIDDCFGKLKQNTEYPYVSGANWSTHNLILWILRQIGPAHLYLATWSMSNDAADIMLDCCRQGQILGMMAVLDWRVKVRTPNLLPILRHNNVDLRVTSCHAKAFILKNANWCVSLVGSANLTNNPRIEAGHLSTSSAIGEFHADWITKEAKNAKPFGGEVGRRKPGKSNAQ